MLKKTPLMEQYEKENLGKHAIWQGSITEQFRIWKEKRRDPSFSPRLIYKGKDGFRIERKSDVNYYANVLLETVERYGLSENPNWDILVEIGKKTLFYIDRSRFRIGYPVMCEIEYRSDIVKIARSIYLMKSQNPNTDEAYTEFCKKVIERIKLAKRNDYLRIMSH